ncbi:MAG: HD-GYP domain-containing protein [Brevinematia bacterium]
MIWYEKFTYYLFLSLLSGTLVYLSVLLILLFLIRSIRMKVISVYGSLASLVYIVGILAIFFLKSTLFIYPLALLVYLLKFVIEVKMLDILYYIKGRYLVYYLVILVITFVLLILVFLGLSDRLFYLMFLVLANLLVGLFWLIKKRVPILFFNNILSMIFLLIFIEYHVLGILFSFVFYGISSIYVTAKEYVLTSKSLKSVGEVVDVLKETQVNKFRDFLFLMINKIESRYTSRKNHSLNVSTIAEGISMELMLDEKVLNLVKESAMIHDIGFLGVDHRKLSTELSYEENQDIIKHIFIGKDLLEKSNIFIKYLPVVLYHHEFVDGSGPEGLKGEFIPLPAKIVAVADKFERLINGRDCKRYSIKRALEFIKKHSGTLYDSKVVKALEKYISKRFSY